MPCGILFFLLVREYYIRSTQSTLENPQSFQCVEIGDLILQIHKQMPNFIPTSNFTRLGESIN